MVAVVKDLNDADTAGALDGAGFAEPF